jgi:hypothetical protein
MEKAHENKRLSDTVLIEIIHGIKEIIILLIDKACQQRKNPE